MKGAAVTLIVLCSFVMSAHAQNADRADAQPVPLPTSYTPEPTHWANEPALFLEANRFTTTKDLDGRPLWLAVGFGMPTMGWLVSAESNTKNLLSSGIEALAWSRLEVLSDFRFPVETVDYYFGLFVTLDRTLAGDSWRFRIGHISSHDVDGKDTVIGGSSSHYSREFIEISTQRPITSRLLVTLGAHGYFHQVTKIEPWFSVPASLHWRMFGRTDWPAWVISSYVSSGAGPVWPSFGVGLRAEHRLTTFATYGSALGLDLFYYYGASWAGTDAGAKVSQLKLQLDVRGL